MKRRPPVGRPWKPGQSGNPSGLSKDTAGRVVEARRLALEHAPRAIATLAELLDDEDARVRIAAAEGLLDRAGLKPFATEPERIEVTAVPVDVDALRAALAARVAGLATTARDIPLDSPGHVRLLEPAGNHCDDGEPRKDGSA